MSSQFLDHATFQHLYDSTVGSYFAWRMKAGRLLSAAQILWEAAHSVQPTCAAHLRGGEIPEDVMRAMEKWEVVHIGTSQAALAIECGLKALWVSQHREQIENIKHLSQLKDIKTHNLAALAAAVGMTLSGDEKELLDVLTDHIQWYGRYMAPTSLDAYKKAFEKPPLTRFLQGSHIYTYDLPFPLEIRAYLKNLVAQLDQVPPGERY